MDINWGALFTRLAVLIIIIISLANSAIAMNCYEQNEALKQEKKNNYTFVFVNIVVQAILILGMLVYIWMAIKQGN